MNIVQSFYLAVSNTALTQEFVSPNDEGLINGQCLTETGFD